MNKLRLIGKRQEVGSNNNSLVDLETTTRLSGAPIESPGTGFKVCAYSSMKDRLASIIILMHSQENKFYLQLLYPCNAKTGNENKLSSYAYILVRS